MSDAGDPFTVAVSRTDPVVVVSVAGEVDAASTPELSGALEAAVRDHERHVVLDATGVTFIDSTGVSAIVAGQRRLNRSRRRLGVACSSVSPLGRALSMSGLDHSFDVHGTVDAAVDSLASAPLLGR